MPKLFTIKEWGAKGIKNTAIADAMSNVYKNSTIYERLDSLIALYEVCAKQQPANEAVDELKLQTTAFIAMITNTRDVAGVIEQRKSLRELWPSFLPNTTLRHLRPFKLASEEDGVQRKHLVKQRLLEHLLALKQKNLLQVNKEDKRQDELHGVTMLSDLEKEAFRIFPADGALWTLRQPSDEDSSLEIVPFDTGHCIAHDRDNGRAIFVLNPQGELFAGSTEEKRFHHSSFQRGGFVAYGGTMEVEKGRLKYIDDYSGHYGPKIKQFFNLIKEFHARKLIQEDTIINYKFRESAGLKLGEESTYLNTRGFLGLPSLKKERDEIKASEVKSEDIDHFEILSNFLYDAVDEESSPSWRIFAVVMYEFLKDKSGISDKLDGYIDDVKGLLSELSIPTDFAEHNPEEYEKYLRIMNELITSNKTLERELGGTDWLPVNVDKGIQNQ
ncbi:hypothetical protein [Legionella spiritensis]|uniref:hypothetical protein n=1 Tax=Legionella spiritensis TaxID=452 RepID=UPI000F6D9451|nr:hypothetical protein [Legionella spiritensis]VEG91639.1 Uncharacterised protein [Legionella spiritensis]